MAKCMVKVSSSGMMVKSMKENSKGENSMEMVLFTILMDKKLEEFGTEERTLSLWNLERENLLKNETNNDGILIYKYL